MRRYVFSLAMATALFLGALEIGASASDYRIGGRWLTDGGGFAEKGILRIELNNRGYLDFRSTVVDGVETITGYYMYGELTATGFEIRAWRQSDDHDYDYPLMVKDFNPSIGNPFVMPRIKIDELEYTVSFTSENSGIISLRGYIDIEVAGRCEVNADNAIWKEGTARPAETPETASGCSSAPGMGMMLPLAVFLLGRRRSNPPG
ncbi:MAG: hypothetical protein LBQ56_05740 [Synergistaceae bacterium]|nr:hypothetical protein [Synergistaceae bacterium]